MIAALSGAFLIGARVDAQDAPDRPGLRPGEPDVVVPVAASAAAGLAGFAVGAFAGARAGHGKVCGDDDCGLIEGLYGAAIGGTLGIALGAHFGNRQRGNFAVDATVAVAVWGAGIALGSALHWRSSVAGPILVAIPIAQIAATVGIERSIGRAHDRGDGIAVLVAPRRGGATIAVVLPLGPATSP
ncbi:MAG: hypothetical protein ACREL5_09185 [Gemmatimonadales bacterium]